MSALVTVLWWLGAAGAVLAFIGMIPGFYEIGRAASGVPAAAAVTSATENRHFTKIIFGAAIVAVLSAAAYLVFRQPQTIVTNYIWLVVAAVLILVAAVPGTALFFSGLNARGGLSAVLLLAGSIGVMVAVLWFGVGYSVAMTEGTALLGGATRLFLQGIGGNLAIDTGRETIEIPEIDIAILHTAIAVLATALITSPFANRIRSAFLLWFGGLWALLVYAPVAHWVWGSDGWLSNQESAFATLLDGAGGSVIYLNAGLAALACALHVGPGRREARRNISFLLSGALILWLGGFASNVSIAATFGADLGTAALTNLLASFASVLGWMFVEWAMRGRITTSGFGFGLFAGISAAAAGSGVVGPLQGLWIGFAAGALSSLSISLWARQFGASNSCLIYAVGGLAGVLLTGLFGLKGGPTEIWRQCLGVAAVGVYDLVGSFVILNVLDWFIGSGVAVESEQIEIEISGRGALATD